ncbi:extracellular solute-binding protein [Rhodococcus koreensis]|uniref:extracellular solute-binding protein n=1 Tax=Rhodococcus koreensis TaxID=99653 RepID=UPI00366B41CA
MREHVGLLGRLVGERRKRIGMSTGVAVAIVLVLAGCGDGPSAEDVAASLTGQELEWYQGAQDEGPVRFYTSQPPSTMNAVIAAFEEKYPGIDVEGLRLSSGSLATRYSQEIEAGSRTADVITIGNTLFARDGLKRGYFETFAADAIPAAAQLDERWFNQGVSTVLINPYGICYNTQAVQDPPQNWADVLVPAYDGRIVFPNFRNAPLYTYAGQHWINQYGVDFVDKLADLHTISADSMIPGLQSVANGQADLGLVCGVNTAAELMNSGAPIEVVMPEDAVAIPDEMAITADAASPNGAKLFYNFLLTEEGQEAFVGTGASSPIGSEGSIPIGDGFVFPDFDGYQRAFDDLAKYF